MTEKLKSLRSTTSKAALGTALGVAFGLALSGFPRRVGLTRAQALVSMPGDLILPMAEVQADRSATFDANPDQVWPFTGELVSMYADLWDVPLRVEYQEEGQLVALVTDFESIDQIPANQYYQASLALRMVSSAPGTCTLQVRERYQTAGLRSAVAVWGSTVSSNTTFRRWTRSVRRALR